MLFRIVRDKRTGRLFTIYGIKRTKSGEVSVLIHNDSCFCSGSELWEWSSMNDFELVE